MAEDQQPLPIDEGRMRALAKTLRDRYSEYDKARSSTEQQWLKNVLVFAAPLAAGSLFEPSVLLPSIGGGYLMGCVGFRMSYEV